MLWRAPVINRCVPSIFLEVSNWATTLTYIFSGSSYNIQSDTADNDVNSCSSSSSSSDNSSSSRSSDGLAAEADDDMATTLMMTTTIIMTTMMMMTTTTMMMMMMMMMMTINNNNKRINRQKQLPQQYSKPQHQQHYESACSGVLQ